MRFHAVHILLFVTACGAGDDPGNGQQAAEANQPVVMVAPADLPTTDRNDVIGATPGPCGSTQATAFLGRAYSPELKTDLQRASGAVDVRIIPPTGETAAPAELRDRRLNVYLNDFGQIIMFDCG